MLANIPDVAYMLTLSPAVNATEAVGRSLRKIDAEPSIKDAQLDRNV
jgi:hypothetical protein